MRMAAQYEMLTQLAKAGTKLDFGQDLFVKFYQAFIASNRWQQYLKGVIPTLYVTAIALTIGVVLGSVVAWCVLRMTSSAAAITTRLLPLPTLYASYTHCDPRHPHDGADADYEHGYLCQQPQLYHGRRAGTGH